MRSVFSTCNYCGCGCGLFLMEKDSRVIGVGPSLNHPVSQGTLCLKGWTSYQYIHSPSRLSRPLIRKGSGLKEASWEEACSAAAEGLRAAKQKFGPQAIALFGSGRATNEELLLLGHLAEEVIGTPNLFLDTLSPSLPYQDLFDGRFDPAQVEDLEAADLIVLVNSDSKEQHPAFSGQVWKALDHGSKVISLSSRRDPLSKHSQVHLQMSPHTEGILLKGLIHLFLSEGDPRWTKIAGANELREIAKEYFPQKVSQVCGILEDDVRSAFSLLKSAQAPIFLYPWGSMEAGKERALIGDLKDLLMIKGQGGKLAVLYPSCNSRAAHILSKNGIEKDLSQVKAILLLGEPYGEDRRAILSLRGGLDLLISLDLFLSPTAEVADIVFPSSSFAEKAGTVTNTEGRVQEVLPAIDPLPGTRPDAEVLTALSSQWGAKAPSWEEVKRQVSQVLGVAGSKEAPKRFCAEPVSGPPESDRDFPFRFLEDPINLRWHTDTRVMRTPILVRELFENYIEMNQEDFRDLGLREGMAAKFISRDGETVAKARPTPALQRGVLFSSYYSLAGPMRIEKV